uniref:NADH dehydrogenase subunit 4 n=1 Tax=Pila globosa TaxID=759386 RepID=UPI0025A96815|nr:NADH dehydrogenase subunit 4 [Pila globosa]WIW42424.1 NADH dehydrogenase subunit 4 [Pila globosa]
MLALLFASSSLLLLCLSKFYWYMNIWVLLVLTMISLLNLNSFSIMFSMYNMILSADSMSSMLILLSFWISSMMILASQNSIHINNNSSKLFCFFVITLNEILILAFSVSNILVFYFMFEASLIPTLMLILGWGYQPERLQAGMYMMLYTVSASLPLLLIILLSKKYIMSMMFMYNCLSKYAFMDFLSAWSYSILLLFIFLAFLVKLPMFFVHLWLPKAHVEAPVAGSMVLAAILLKLGGYGIFRSYQYFNINLTISTIFLLNLALWGGVLTSMICFRQIDLKSLIAYSSIGHMSLVLAGVFSNNVWGWSGSVILMIAHGLCSSALFALANYSYEKTHTRSLFMNKGMLMSLPILSLWWFMFSAMNMAAPPSINLAGEILMFPSVISFFSYSIVCLMFMSFLAAVYSMYLYSGTQHGASPKFMVPFNSFSSSGLTLMFFHWIPANLFVMKIDIFML